jgi:conjugal transfer mating pair stabilization protein TraN
MNWGYFIILFGALTLMDVALIQRKAIYGLGPFSENLKFWSREIAINFIIALFYTWVTTQAFAQTTQSEAKEQARSLGREGATKTQVLVNEESAATSVPGYSGTETSQSALFSTSDDSALGSAASSAMLTNEGFLAARESDRRHPRFSPTEIGQSTQRGAEVRKGANDIVQGIAGDGSKGQCVELPPSADATNFYEASCNIGFELDPGERVCRITLKHNFTQAHKYSCSRIHERGPRCLQGSFPNCPEPDVADDVLGSGCDAFEGNPVCSFVQIRSRVIRPANNRVAAVFYDEFEAQCSESVKGSVVGTGFTGSDRVRYNPVLIDEGFVQIYGGSVRDESQCAALAGNSDCNTPVETCVDATPATRVINGVSITQSCWGFERRYTCSGKTPAQDCSAIEANRSCTFVREDCLDDPQVGACVTRERIYRCPSPDQPAATKQFVCGGDLYCVNGECETIERETSDELKDALVGLHALGQAGKEFDESDFALFKGSNDTCSKPVFGLANCCGGNGIPLIGTCSSAEKQLEAKIDKGLCHFIGSFCSKSVFGVCTSKRKSYCCYQSKLTRIIQEGGRAQLGLIFGTPKRADCAGFTIEQFASLDLSKIDFTEIYNELVEAVKLPDEAQALVDIQTKIKDFYAANGG